MNIIFYHANCADGFGAAFAAWRKFGDEGAVYLPVSYGQAIPDLREPWARNHLPHHVFIVDFSWPAAQLLALAESPDVESVVVLDHHACAKRELESLSHPKIDIRFSDEESGAAMAWHYFHGENYTPQMIRAVEDYDINWPPKICSTRALHAGLWRGRQRTFRDWNGLLMSWGVPFMPGSGHAECYAAGQAILASDEITLASLSGHAEHIHGPDGELGLAVNSPVLPNETAERLLEMHPLAEFVAIYYERRGEWKCSLRSRQGGYDVSRLAARYGGGGHPSASSFRYPAVPLVSIPALFALPNV